MLKQTVKIWIFLIVSFIFWQDNILRSKICDSSYSFQAIDTLMQFT